MAATLDVAPGLRGLPRGLPYHQPVDRKAFPDGLRTSGQHPPIESQIRPFDAFPTEITGPTVWEGRDIAARQGEWVHRWTDGELNELLQAVDAFTISGIPLININKHNFSIPNVTRTLQAVRHDILNGRGFVLFRGLPVEAWGRQKAAIAMMGISAHLGYLLSQNKLGQVLGHVTNLEADYKNSLDKVKIAATNAALALTLLPLSLHHTDEADIVGLLFCAPGESGGASGCASAHTVWNALVRERPDVAKLLASPVWYCDRKGEITAGQEPWIKVPVFYLEPGGQERVYVKWDPYFVKSLTRYSDKGLIPALSPQQLEAMDILEKTCARYGFEYTCEVGDVQFVSCCQTFHSRTAFVDALPPKPPRHLLRTWRGGIQVDSTPPTANPLVASGGTD
ncbi:hypothetical protein LLEC1_02227 [Akanthomyces lecanii]|uniref:TauD/TfdA-like domain-containing protein n=1 Tax=Cordyceps confragosa TaxID=2714763 RepID=A0A179I3H0_CORDF|nr:hypothetical protein LLEC1_02227 [Akanthomyces lecanii]